MNVIINIEDREAIPVRAIPLLTNWRFMSPDIVCHVLGGTAGSNVGLFGELQASYLKSGRPQPINADWWVQFPLKKLQALTKEIKSTKPIDDVGYSAWQQQSLKELPAGVFVWKDEYQQLHDENWKSQYSMNVCALQGLDSQDNADDFSLKRDIMESIAVMKRWEVPNFSPFMSADQQHLVMEGFDGSPTGTAPARTAAPMVAARDGKPWLMADPRDPAPEQPWYTPARYFARQLVISDSTLLTKRLILADKVSKSLYSAGFFKRGGKSSPSAETVLKAFANVTLG